MEYVFLTIVTASVAAIFYIVRSKNSWDALFLNSTLAILALCFIGVLADENELWFRIVGFIGLVAIGSGAASVFFRHPENK